MKASFQINIAPPPRRVPGDVRRCIWFGGYAAQFGFGALAIGIVAASVAVYNSDLTSRYYFRGGIVQTEGRITSTEKTSLSEGGSSRGSNRDGRPIFAYHYVFTDTADVDRQGTSYQKGYYGDSEAPKVHPVVVEYPEGRPDVSRLAGMRRRPFSEWLGLVGLAPLVGLGLLAVHLPRAAGWSQLLRLGVPTRGTLATKVQTSTQINKQHVYKLTFAFTAFDGTTHEAVARTHVTSALEDEPTEMILYDPSDPQRAVLLDSLPGSITFDESGSPTLGRPASEWKCMLLPGLALLAIVVCVWAGFQSTW